MARTKYYNPATGQWEYADLSAGGKDGEPGAPGKSAYEYAKDGGYTGTEAEFAAKLAEEIPQADMAQNDPTAADYIKNRTHWKETQVVELLPETTVALSGGMGTMAGSLPLVVGETYTLVVNGTAYECVAFEGSMMGMDFVGIGNKGYVTQNPADFNDIPCAVGSVDAMGMWAAMGYEASYTIKIIGKKTVYHQLEVGYVPTPIFYIDITENEDDTYTTSTTMTEGVSAYNTGRVIIARIFTNDYNPRRNALIAQLSGTLFEGQYLRFYCKHSDYGENEFYLKADVTDPWNLPYIVTKM